MGGDDLPDPTLQLFLTFDAASFFENSRDAPTALNELVMAVIPLIIDAMREMFSSIMRIC